MRYSNLHTHTVFSDGACMPEDMVRSAIEKNMLSLGFSDHSPMDHDLTYCVKHQALPAYHREIRRLKEKYKDQIEIALGLEMDSLTSSCVSRADYDYVIGDCHYVHTADGPMSIDHCIEGQRSVLENYFSMDGVTYSKSYFRTYLHDMQQMKPDILGHFDLTVKFGLIREDDPAYLSAAREALAAALEITPVIEMNTGAMARGLRSVPYPAPYLLDVARSCGGKFILSSDCHAAENLIFAFDEARQLLIAHGFDSMVVWKNGALQEVGLE